MGANGAMTGKLRRPDVDYSNKRVMLQTKDGTKFAIGPSVIRDKPEQLTAARRIYVAQTGKNDLTPVEKTGAFKKFTKEQKRKYYKLNPQEAPEEDLNFTLSRKTLLGA
jgi:hypothetical protein